MTARAAAEDFLDRLAAWQTELRLVSGALLLRVLDRRFGAVPARIAARVAAARRPELERWFDRALDAESFDDVFGGP